MLRALPWAVGREITLIPLHCLASAVTLPALPAAETERAQG